MNDKKLGDVYTSSIVVNYMLDMVGYMPDADLSNTTIIEPSCGEGAFAVEIIKRLKKSSENFGFNFTQAVIKNVLFIDTDIEKINICQRRLDSNCLAIPETVFINEDFLITKIDRFFDVVIGNPPYIRHEKIDSNLKQVYKDIYTTFKYRADLYIPFFEKSLSLLNPNGKHCFICSNRWFKSQYGAPLRSLISDKYSLRSIINMEHTNPFEDTVSAYPAVTLIENNRDYKSSIGYLCIDDINDLQHCNYQDINRSNLSDDWSAIFNNHNLNDTLWTITELGFDIGIGVATGADDIFIGRDLPANIEKTLLLPIINSKDITPRGIEWRGNYLFNPFDDSGNIIDLGNYPRAEKYLLSHSERLKNRYIARKKPSNWYRTIDKVKTNVLSAPKIILPDISANKFIQIDNGEFYPHHNLYYITSDSINELKLLSCILMTDFVYEQLCSLSNLMNGGYPRWQSQFVKKLKIPNFRSWDDSTRIDILKLYDKKDLHRINQTISVLIN